MRQNKGNNEDAEDVFQEAIVVLLQKVKQPDFVLTAALKTCLYAIGMASQSLVKNSSTE